MSLKHAILSMLVDCEKSGYDINKEFSGTIGYYWSASHQQIYKTLATMLEQDWVSFRTVEQTDKPDKKFYQLTPSGRQELIDWASKPCKESPDRNELLIKIRLAGTHVPAEVLINELQRLLEKQQQRLAIYQDIKQQFFEPAPTMQSNPQMATSYLTLRYGTSTLEAKIAWTKEAIKTLQQ